MPLAKKNKEERNAKILERFRFHRKKNPKWTVVAVIEETAQEFYLNPSTIGKILKQGGTKAPCTHTITKNATAVQQTLF